jgi:ABC-type branched-subunit amino acid transport system substrate-binding protein
MEEQQPSSGSASPTPAPKSRRTLWAVIAVVVVVVLVLVAAVLAGLFNPPPAKVTVLRIGTILSKTGSLSAYGTDNENGTQMAVDEINAAGGVLGNPIAVTHLDDNTNPATAASDARTEISQNNVAAIVGATGSGQCSTIVPVAANNSVVEVSASCTSPKFSNQSLTKGWFFRTAPSDALQGVVAASYAYTNLSQRRAAVIGINNAYGTGLSTVFANSFTHLGGTLTSPARIVDEIGSGATDYTTDLVALLGTSPAPQFVYVVAYPPDGVKLMEDWNTGLAAHPSWKGVNFTFSEGLYDSTFINPLVTAGVNVSAFLGTAPSAYGGLHGPQYLSWKANYTTKFHVAPTLFTANAYDAVYLIALSAQKAGDASGASVKANLIAVSKGPGTNVYPGTWATGLAALKAGQAVNYEGASGSVNLNANGDPTSGYVVWNVTKSNSLSIKEIYPESLVLSLVSSIGASSVSVQSVLPVIHGSTLTDLLQAVDVVAVRY